MTIATVRPDGDKVEVKSLNSLLQQAIYEEVNLTSGRASSAPALNEVVGWAFRCVSLISGTASAVPFTISRIGSDDPLWDSDVSRLPPAQLARWEGLGDLVELTAQALVLYGEGYWHRLRNLAGRDVGYEWMAPAMVDPAIETGTLEGFRRTTTANAYEWLMPEDVIYFWYPDPTVELGPPRAYPGRAAMASGNVLKHLDGFLAQHFDRGMIKATLLTVDGPIAAADKDELRSWWQNAASGLRNAWSSRVIRAGRVVPVTIGEGVSDLGNQTLTDEHRQGISTAFGVPHSMVMANAANYATAKQDAINLYTLTVIPLLKMIASVVNRQVLYDEGLELSFEFDRIEAMQQQQLETAMTISQLVGAPVMTVEEGREWLGLDPMAVLPAPAPVEAKSTKAISDDYVSEVAAALELYASGDFTAEQLRQAWKMLAARAFETAFRQGARVSSNSLLMADQDAALQNRLNAEYQAIDTNVDRLEDARRRTD